MGLSLTHADISMDAKGNIFVYYDDMPDRPVGASPGDPSYQVYLDLTDGLAPGTRMRMHRRAGVVSRESGGVRVFGFVYASGGGGEAASWLIGTADPRYACYEPFVERFEPGQSHYVKYRDQLTIDACVAAIGESGQP